MIHLLRPDSVTPIAMYLERRRQNPSSAAEQIDFAAVLLYREREYQSMYSSRWLLGSERPRSSADSPFAPYDLTPDAARILAAALDGRLHGDQPDDLFGLKAEAVAGLAETLRPIQSMRFGWLIYARLLEDLRRFEDAQAAADHARRLGESIPDQRAREALDERIRRRALRVRACVEGDAFTRFLTTEQAFCDAERASAMATFDDARVPEELRALIPLAREFGVGDDVCRGLFIRRTRAADRRAAAEQILAHADAIQAWLDALGAPPYEGEAAAFFWLLTAGEELAPGR